MQHRGRAAAPAAETRAAKELPVAFPGLQHIAITVADLERSTQWYSRLLGAEPVLDEDEESGTFHHTVFVLGGGQLLGLHTHRGAESGDPFDEHRTGLDHIAFALSGTAELEQWRDRLDELSIAHGGIKKAHYGSGISFRDPDNIALEFFIAPGT
jgi:glyoxylase I family protein